LDRIRLVARKLRIQYPGAIYHVVNRGDRREAIFADDVDRERLLETLSEACQKIGWPVQAYCLMGNHFPAVLIMASERVLQVSMSQYVENWANWRKSALARLHLQIQLSLLRSHLAEQRPLA